ncbi:uncharacterized protein [Ptychodera flava]|uniref:uncharacterized protein n=1 Tax=Ptychodera flava TaxID=63121 RepID=UPI00396A1458
MAEKMDHSPAVDSHRGLTSQKKRCHSDDDNDKSDVDLDSSVDDHGAPVLMEKLRRFSKRLVTSNTTVRCQGAAERYRPESCGCATRCSADRCPCVKSNTTCNEACQCVDCSNPFIQLQLLSHYGLSLVQCKQDVCLMEALPKLTDQELRQILGTHVPMDCCDTFVTLFELIPDKRPCPNHECDRTYTYSWCENRVLPVTEESERNHCPKRRRCIKPTEQQSHEQVPIQVEENNVGEQRNLGVSSMSSPDKDKGQKAMRKTNKFKSPRLLCMFCGKTQAKLSRHLQTMHKSERTLNHALTLSRALESDQYKSQPSSGPVDGKRYLKNCDKAKHARQLHREEAKTDQCLPTQHSSPGPSKEVNSKRKYREKVLDRLSQDSIGVLCRQDTMIVETGWKLYQNCCDNRNYEFVREHIRNLGSLLSQCRNISGNESMAGEDLLNKKYFHVVVTAIRNRSSGLSGNALQARHWKMRHILQNAFETMKAKYTAEGIVHKGKAVDHFYNELLAKWQLLFTTQRKLSGNAKATQKHKVSSAQKQKLKSAYQLKVSKKLSRHNKQESLSKKRGKERHKPATLSTQRDTGRHKTATLSTGRDTGRHETATLSTGRDTGRHKTATLSTGRDTGRHKPATLSTGRDTGRHEPATLSTGRDTGRHKPATLSTGRDTGRHEPATLSTGRDTGKYTAKPPSLDRDTEKPESEMLSIERR